MLKENEERELGKYEDSGSGEFSSGRFSGARFSSAGFTSGRLFSSGRLIGDGD